MAPRLMPGQKAAPKEEETPTTADLMSAIRNKGGGGNLKVHPSCAPSCASHHAHLTMARARAPTNQAGSSTTAPVHAYTAMRLTAERTPNHTFFC